MSRDALVVGINSYDHLPPLTAPAKDAEAIAKLLENYGEFKVTRLPAVKDRQNNTICIGQKTSVTVTQLEESIVQLFKPKGKPPETGLLYFSGHGLLKDRGVQEGFLAATDINPKDGKWGLSLKWLRQLLQESDVSQVIIILDCCHSGELLNFDEADPGNRGKKGDRCFIAACRDFEKAYEEIDSTHSVLTKVLLKGLEPSQKGWVTNLDLAAFMNRKDHPFPQVSVCENSGQKINLTCSLAAPIKEVAAKSENPICPYKGLAYFDFNDEDPKYFHGRLKLTDDLLQKVKSGNFLAVLGASGSGKSSVIRAGLLYQLKLGHRLSGSDTWQISIFRPSEHPFQRLVEALVQPGLSTADHAIELGKIKKLIGEDPVEGLVNLITANKAECVVLVVDQFEEVFTLCRNSRERQRFFDCLLGALKRTDNKYRLVISMRADFLGKCAEYSDLAQKIQDHQVIICPMEENELKEAITEPARKVGLEIELELVNQMIAEVMESKGRLLPMLQYTLRTLCEPIHCGRCASDLLTLQTYTKLGGIRGALPKRADAIYNEFSPVEQKVARKIFLELTQLGEGTEDTRRQVPKQDLLNSHSNPEVVEQIIQKLAQEEARLLVTDKPKDSSTGLEVVDVAHEALIRHWDRLSDWLNKSRDDIRRERKIEADAKEWLANDRAEEYLLRGRKLREAEVFLEDIQKDPDKVFFDKDAKQFVQQSIQREKEEQEKEQRIEQERIQRKKEEQERKQREIQQQLQRKQEELKKQKQRLLRNRIVLGLTVPVLFGVLAWIWNNSQNAGIVRLSQNSNRLSDSNKEADALVESLKSAKALKASLVVISPNTRIQVIAALGRAIYDLKEMNSLEGHRSAIKNVGFSPDRKTLASVDDDGVIKLWNSDGTLRQTIHGHSRYVNGISFSPDGKMFASASGDGTVKLWNLADSKLIQTFLGHSRAVNKIIFSTDGKNLVSASDDGSIKVWSLDGSLLRTIKVGSSVKDITFSPDGKFLASSETNGGRDKLKDGTIDNSKDGIIKLWNWNSADEKPIKTIPTKQCNNTKCTIWAVRFSPDGKFLATASENRTIKLWKSDGTYVGYIDGPDKDDSGHNDQILSLSFSPNISASGEYLLASASRDQSVRVWSVRSDYDINPPIKEELKPKVLELAGHEDKVSAVEFTPDGKILASVSNDKTVKFWNIDSRLQELKHEKEKAKSVSFSPDGKTIASSGQSETNSEGIIHLWNWNENRKSWEEKSKIPAHKRLIWQVSFSPDGEKLASASWDGTINLWSKQGELLASSANIGKSFYSVSFSPDGKLLASGDADKNVIIWEYEGNSLTQKQVLPNHTNDVRSVSFSPDGKWLASADLDNVIKLWRREGNSWKLIRDLEGHRNSIKRVIFSPDGQLLASASDDRTVKLWDINGKLINTLYGHTGKVTDIDFRPDSQVLASVGADKKVILWGRNGNLLHTINKHDGVISSVQFSPDGQTLASAGDDHRVILWNLNLEQLLEEGCTLSSGYLRANPSRTSEIRSLCNIPEVDPKLLVEQGRDLARQGKIEKAIAKFNEAQERGQTLGFKPKEEAENLFKASRQLKEGLNAAMDGKIDEAAKFFEEAIKGDSAFHNSGIKPVEEAERLHKLYPSKRQ
ncbi:caspase family protein [Anabaena sp. PCC 7108]|uniref:nSTAND1 domain-containing NTPase n=1 Tax=Anabaena sp. PCC 7108 TaxID=163908 RepID=UPI00034B12BB|nr:caspase family protein [Anabaena sp. PCC 7108]